MKVLLLDSLRSMQNIGAIFRNADGSWFDKIYLSGHCSIPPRSDIHKTALGAERWIDWEYYNDPLEILTILKKQRFFLVSVELSSRSKNYTTLFENTHENICLILGNEVSGVQEKILSISDEIVMIPMLWQKESLNVSVAAGIVMYATVNS